MSNPVLRLRVSSFLEHEAKTIVEKRLIIISVDLLVFIWLVLISPLGLNIMPTNSKKVRYRALFSLRIFNLFTCARALLVNVHFNEVLPYASLCLFTRIRVVKRFFAK